MHSFEAHASLAQTNTYLKIVNSYYFVSSDNDSFPRQKS